MTARRLLAVVPLLAVAVLSGCGQDEAGDPSADRSSAPSSTAPEWPPAAAPGHGGQVWAVYLAVEDPGDPSLEEVADHAGSLGYADDEVGGGQVGCDQGAAEALGVDAQDTSVAIYFDTQERAEQFTALYDRPYVGYAQVTAICLD